MSLRRLAAVAIVAAVLAGVAMTWLLYPAPILPGSAEVPALRGMPVTQAVTELAALGLRGRLADELADPMVPVGAVSWQSPAPFTVLPESSVVQLGVSAGPPMVLVPDLVDLDLGTARRVLEAAGLVLGSVDRVWSHREEGAIILTRPDPRSARQAGSSVEVTVSRGPQGGTE